MTSHYRCLKRWMETPPTQTRDIWQTLGRTNGKMLPFFFRVTTTSWWLCDLPVDITVLGTNYHRRSMQIICLLSNQSGWLNCKAAKKSELLAAKGSIWVSNLEPFWAEEKSKLLKRKSFGVFRGGGKFKSFPSLRGCGFCWHVYHHSMFWYNH